MRTGSPHPGEGLLAAARLSPGVASRPAHRLYRARGSGGSEGAQLSRSVRRPNGDFHKMFFAKHNISKALREFPEDECLIRKVALLCLCPVKTELLGWTKMTIPESLSLPAAPPPPAHSTSHRKAPFPSPELGSPARLDHGKVLQWQKPRSAD